MTAPAETIRLLADRIRHLESSARLCAPAAIPLGGLAELFPHGLTAGALVELLPSGPGAGAWTLALTLARHACGERKTLLIADPERCFYPPAACKFGLDVERTVIVRPRQAREAISAVVQALRCGAIGATVGAFERLADRDARRLQLAAEAGGALGILVRPPAALGAPSFAAVRLRLEPLPSRHGRRCLRVEVLRCRQAARTKPQTTCQVEIDDATGHVRAFSALELAENLASPA
jgi:hypothetical protein